MAGHIYSVDSSCTALYIQTTCWVQAALVEYWVEIRNRSMTAWNPNSTPYENTIAYGSPGDSQTANGGDGIGPLGALQMLAVTYLEELVVVYYNKADDGWSSQLTQGVLSSGYENFSKARDCDWSWQSPIPDILDAFDKLMFWAALDSANESNNAPYYFYQQIDILAYRSVHIYLILATILFVAALTAISSTLYGWWDLKRGVSLSPLEIAKAFGSEVFKGWDIHTDGESLAYQMGERKFRYCEMEGEEQRLFGFKELKGEEELGSEEMLGANDGAGNEV